MSINNAEVRMVFLFVMLFASGIFGGIAVDSIAACLGIVSFGLFLIFLLLLYIDAAN